jgi:hypothetical protein
MMKAREHRPESGSCCLVIKLFGLFGGEQRPSAMKSAFASLANVRCSAWAREIAWPAPSRYCLGHVSDEDHRHASLVSSRLSQSFHGAKAAQNDAGIIERIGVLFLPAEAHNLMVIGSNSARTGKGAQRAHHWFHVQAGPQPLRGGVADS